MPYGATVGTTGGSADAVVVSHTHTATVTDPGHANSLPIEARTFGGGGAVNSVEIGRASCRERVSSPV